MSEPTLDFPFVAELPKREKSKVAKLWDHFKEVRAIVAEKGLLCPPTLAGDLLGISRQRIHELIGDGRFETVEFNGHRFVTENSVIAYAKSERKAGRPTKLPETKSEAWNTARNFAKSSRKASKK